MMLVKSENDEQLDTNNTSGRVSNEEKKITRNQLIHQLITTTDDPSNPITHKTANSKPVEVVVSCSTGHQVSSHGGRRRSDIGNYMKAREQKIKNQAAGKRNDLFRGIIAWIDGYTGPTITNLELKDLVHSNGGFIAMYPGKKVTHILTAASLSGSKTQALLTKTAGWKPVVVDPMWIVECVKAGKRIGFEKWRIGGTKAGQPSIGRFLTHSGSTSPLAEPPPSQDVSVSSVSSTSNHLDRSSALPTRTRKRTSIHPSVSGGSVKPTAEVIDLCDSDND